MRRNAEALVEKGHQVDLFCLRALGQASCETISGVNAYRFPVQHHRQGIARYLFEYWAFFLLTFLTLTWRHIRRHYDIVEVDTMPDFLVFSTVVPKLLGARVVLYLFEAMPEAFASKYGIDKDHPVIKCIAFIEQLAIRYADHVITACEAFRSVFVARGAPKDKITVVLNVPNEGVFRPDLVADYQEKHRRDGSPGFTLITHGTLTEIYGVQVLIRAVARLKDQLPGLKLLVVGGGEFSRSLKALAQELGVSDIADFTGWVCQENVVKMILDADVGVVPILGGYGEMMVPNKLFEYVALGKPVVSSSLRGIRHYFGEDSLLFFNPGDDSSLAKSIERLYRDLQLRESIALKASKIYEQYRWQRAKEVYCGLFEE